MAEYLEPNDLNSAALVRSRVHPALTGLDGAGIVICVIDYGFDLVHPAFRTATGETRFAALIDQNGHLLERAEINALLRTADRTGDRSAIDNIYDPHAHYFGRDGVQIGAHGSWVASIAAGSRTAEFCGVAPNATLVGVQLDLPDSAWREEDANGRPTWLEAAAIGGDTLSTWDGWRSYEDSEAIVCALEESVAFARTLRPEGIVVNLSIGAWAGGHDQGSAVSRTIEAITDAGRQPGEPMTVVVTGTGNAGSDDGHCGGHRVAADPLHFEWSFIPGYRAQSKLEIWTDCAGDFAVEIAPRFGDRQPICTLTGSSRGTSAIMLSDGQIIGIAEHRGAVRGGLSAVRILLHPALGVPSLVDAGQCTFDVTVRPLDAGTDYVVHAWLERDCTHGTVAKLFETLHEPPSRGFVSNPKTSAYPRQTTLTSIACARSVIAVAGLDNAAAVDTALPLSGGGPRAWPANAATLPVPLLAAPANGLFGARSKTAGFMRGSGTSGAAAIVSGACALAMQAAALGGRRLALSGLVNALLGRPITLTNNDNLQSEPDAALGHGALRFDASAALDTNTYPRNPNPSRTQEPSDERTISTAN